MRVFIHLFAARGPVDFAWKLAILLLAVNLLNIAQSLTFDGADRPSIGTYIRGASTVALPFLLLAMLLIGHLDRLQRDLHRLARTDTLTGLLNRRAFMEMDGPGRRIPKGTLLMLDVDHFKKVNDVHGHAVGDDCLVSVAELLRAMTRSADRIARLGGEEFVVLLVGADADDARQVGQRIARGVKVLNREDGSSFRVTISLGLTPTAPKYPLDVTLRRADEALYLAKKSGRARVVEWTPPQVAAA